MTSTQQQRILEQYSTQAGRCFYRYVMGDGSDHIHYGLYGNKETTMIDALTASCQQLFKMALSHIDLASLNQILDLGAGAGGPAKCLLSWTNARMTCVDLGGPPLQALEQWAQTANLSHRLRTFNESFHKLPTEWAKEFDLVWSQDALCHAADRVAVFSETRRVLRPGGAFVFSDILLAENAPEEFARAFTAVNAVQNLGTFKEYYRDLQQAGFSSIRCEDWTSHLPMNFQRMRQQIENWRPSMLQEGVNAEIIDRFADALDQRLRWPPGAVLKWCAFLCIVEEEKSINH